MIGKLLGPYEILAKIGAGGMGEVYRAKDTRLDRFVAIKILPPEVAGDPDRLSRFAHEARAAAALNHPNLLAVYDVGQEHRVAYLVTELLEGRTLGDLLAGETLAMSRVVDLAAQIADGLAAAHARGIVHRDIKPDNLFVTTDGRVKILDFGLAKVTEVGPQVMADAPTRAATAPHTVLGTLGYMAPEQVRGEPVDSRADVFAFGCVLYEMLSGRRAFTGTTSLDMMSAILKDAPASIETTTTRAIPPTLVRVIDRCLEKTPATRFQSTTDLAFALRALTTSSTAAATERDAAPIRRGRPSRWRSVLPWVLAAGLGASTLVLLWLARSPVPSSHTISRFAIGFSAGDAVGIPAISPDGRTIVYPLTRGGTTMLYVRGVDQFEAKPLPGTEGGAQPFFSPDSKSVAFVANGQIKRTSFDAGGVTTVCPDVDLRGATWGPDDTIVFAMWPQGELLWRVPAAGGTPEPLGPRHAGQQVTGPQFFPDGRHILYAVRDERWNLEVYSLADQSVRRVLTDARKGRLLSTGQLMFVRGESTLMSVPFDADRLSVRGTTISVAEIQGGSGQGFDQYDLSLTGSLVFRPKPPLQDHDVLWMTSQGREMPSGLPQRPYAEINLSRDGRRIVAKLDADLWIGDLARGTLTRFATGHTLVWSPDSRHVAYVRDGRLFSADVDAGPESERPLSSTWFDSTLSMHWSPDGTLLAFNAAFPQSSHDILLLPLGGSAAAPTARPFVQTPADEVDPRFSPDGRWLAYWDVEHGLFVRSVDGSGRRTQISDAGMQPRWAANGRELFYVNADRLWVVPVEPGAEFRAGTPHALFALPVPSTSAWTAATYDVAPDGRFLFVKKPSGPPPPPELRIVVNWSDELRAGRPK